MVQSEPPFIVYILGWRWVFPVPTTMISLLSILSHSDKDLEVWKWQVTGPAYVVCDHVSAHPQQCREENGDEMVDLKPH